MKSILKPQPHTRKKRTQETGRTVPPVLKYAVPLAIILMTGILFYVWLHVQMVGLSYEISKAQKQKKELVEINKKLRIQWASLRAPDRIEQIALNQLGLRSPERGQIEILP
ncbi:MAG TPA: cell division protein FtsL [Thermodesulfobacteriota bacterium]|nr:cell division protein FtsL [Thermodesulfobacteriota bacterium]